MKNSKSLVAVACAAAGCLTLGVVTQSATASIIIDDFTQVEDPSQWPIELFALGSQTITEVGLNTIGNSRQTYVEAISLGQVDSVEINIFTGTGSFQFFSSSDAQGFVSLLYNGGGSLNADFSQQLSIDMSFSLFDFANSNPLPITITMSDGTNSAEHTLSLTSAGAQNISFLFEDFTNIGMLDLSSIQSIQIDLAPGVAADWRIDSIFTTMPSPGAIALLGAAGLITTRRRRS